MSYHCWECGCPSVDGVHYCSHCNGTHHFITWDQLNTIRDGYAVGKQMPEPPLDSKLLPKHFSVPPPKSEPEPVASKAGRNRSDVAVPGVVPDRMTRHYDYASGDWIESRAQKRRIYKEKGMVQVSAKEEWRDRDKPRGSGYVASYRGQKNHQSSAERGGVRTATGQRVV